MFAVKITNLLAHMAATEHFSFPMIHNTLESYLVGENSTGVEIPLHAVKEFHTLFSDLHDPDKHFLHLLQVLAVLNFSFSNKFSRTINLRCKSDEEEECRVCPTDTCQFCVQTEYVQNENEHAYYFSCLVSGNFTSEHEHDHSWGWGTYTTFIVVVISGIIWLAYCILAHKAARTLLFCLCGPVELCLKFLLCKCCRDDHRNSMQQRNADEEMIANPAVLSDETDISIMNLDESPRFPVMNLDESRPWDFETGPPSYGTLTWIPQLSETNETDLPTYEQATNANKSV